MKPIPPMAEPTTTYLTRHLPLSIHDRIVIYAMHWDMPIECVFNTALEIGLNTFDDRTLESQQWRPEVKVITKEVKE